MDEDVSEATPVVRGEIGLNRRGTARRLLWAALAGSVVGCPAGGVLMDVARPGLLAALRVAFGWTLLLTPLALLVGAAYAALAAPRRPGEVRVADGALVLGWDGARPRSIPLSKVRAGYLSLAQPAEPQVHFVLASGNIVRVRVANASEGEALLRAAGMDPSQRRVTYKIRRVFYNLLYALLGAPWLVVLGGFLGNLAGIMTDPRGRSENGWLFGAGVGVALAVLVHARFLGPRVTVGSDGVEVTYGFRTRFYAFADVSAVTLADARIVFALRDGRRVRVWANGDGEPAPGVLVERIEAARERFVRGEAEGAALASLARAGRTVRAWREALSAARARGVGYRDAAALSPAELRRVLDDVAAGVEQRIGAALALVSAGDPEDRARVRVAAQASASEPVRVALERAAADALDDDALDAAVRADPAASARRAG